MRNILGRKIIFFSIFTMDSNKEKSNAERQLSISTQDIFFLLRNVYLSEERFRFVSILILLLAVLETIWIEIY